MRLLLLAADDTDADEWIAWFTVMSPNLRTTSIDVDRTPITVVTPADDLRVRLDPAHERWTRPESSPIKVLRTDAAKFATEPKVLSALALLGHRHTMVDPTGLLGPSREYLEAHAGWQADDRTAPMGVITQRKARPGKPFGVHRVV
jgi:hypothetical protein